MGSENSKAKQDIINKRSYSNSIVAPYLKSICQIGSGEVNGGILVEIKAQPSDYANGNEAAYKVNDSTQDKRERIENTEVWPNSVHGLVHSLYQNGINNLELWGTGTMIGLNLVITAAHNLYNHDLEKEATCVKFYPGLNGKRAHFNEIEVKKFYYPDDFVRKVGNKEDYALLVLNRNIGNETGYFALHLLSNAEIKSKTLNVVGYPQDKIKDKEDFYEMWGMSGKAGDVDEQHISYKITTYNGQSGSGVFYKDEDENKYYVVGVHKKYSRMKEYNQATLLNKKRMEQLQKWSEEANIILPLKSLFSKIICINFEKNYQRFSKEIYLH